MMHLFLTALVLAQLQTKPYAGSAEGRALINKVREFVGDKSVIEKVQTMREVGTMSLNTPNGPVEMQIESTTRFPESQRNVMKTPDAEMTMVYTPDAAFMIGPMGLQEMPEAQRKNMHAESKQEILNVLKNIDNPAYAFSIVGTENNRQIVEINADGTTFKWSIDPETGRLFKNISQGRRGEQVMEYSDWQNFSGLNLPAAFTAIANGQPRGVVKYTKVEINPTLDQKAFEKPNK
jgi:hypothetical protein